MRVLGSKNAGVTSVRATCSRTALACAGIAAVMSVTAMASGPAAATGRHGVAPRSTVTARIPLAHLPRSMVTDPRTDMIYVSEFFGELQVINGRTDSVVASVPVPGRAPFVAVDQVTDMIYVTGSRYVSVVSGRTNTVVAKIRLGPSSFIATDPLTNRIYVQAFVSTTAGKLDVVNGRTNKVIATVPDANSSWGVATDPKTNTVYFGGAQDSLLVLNGQTDTVAATITNIQGSDITADPLTNTVYVPDPFSDGGGGETFVVNGQTSTITTSVPGNSPVAATVDGHTDMVYVANTFGGFLGTPGLVSVINGKTSTITANIKLSGTPFDIAVDSLTNKVYVACANKHARWVTVLGGIR